MKKIIAFFLVMAMAQVANATVIDIAITSLNGEPVPMTNEITVSPTDIVGLAITFDAPPTEYLYSLEVTVNVVGPATLIMDPEVIQAHPDFDWTLESIEPPYLFECAGFGMGPQGEGEGNPVIVVENILVQCDDIGDVQVYLTDYPYGHPIILDENGIVVPSEYGPGVIIHQEEGGPVHCWECPRQPYGDANGDGTVNSLDVLALKKAWQTTSANSSHGTGDGEYNCCVDFNHDDKITNADSLIIRRNWQAQFIQTCPEYYCP